MQLCCDPHLHVPLWCGVRCHLPQSLGVSPVPRSSFRPDLLVWPLSVLHDCDGHVHRAPGGQVDGHQAVQDQGVGDAAQHVSDSRVQPLPGLLRPVPSHDQQTGVGHREEHHHRLPD